MGRCILGSVAVTDFEFTARMLQKYGDQIAVGVDAKDGFVAIHGWKEVSAEKGVDFCKRLAAAGCKAIIYTDIACDGAMQGTNLALYRQLSAEVPGVEFTASGGISSEAELLELERMGWRPPSWARASHRGAGPCPLRTAGTEINERETQDDHKTHHSLSGCPEWPGGQGHQL